MPRSGGHPRSPEGRSLRRTLSSLFAPETGKWFRFRSTDPRRFRPRSDLHIPAPFHRAFPSAPDWPDRRKAVKSGTIHFRFYLWYSPVRISLQAPNQESRLFFPDWCCRKYWSCQGLLLSVPQKYPRAAASFHWWRDRPSARRLKIPSESMHGESDPCASPRHMAQSGILPWFSW